MTSGGKDMEIELNHLKEELDKCNDLNKAMEQALRGHCYCCANAQPPKIETATGFPNMIWCEHLADNFKSVLAQTGLSKRDCGFWDFALDRYMKILSEKAGENK